MGQIIVMTDLSLHYIELKLHRPNLNQPVNFTWPKKSWSQFDWILVEKYNSIIIFIICQKIRIFNPEKLVIIFGCPISTSFGGILAWIN